MRKEDNIYKNKFNFTNNLKEDDVIVILDDIEFAWRREDIKYVINLWKYGKGIKYISEKLGRNGDEVFLLLIHLARKGEIKKRKGYIWGRSLTDD